MRFLHTADWHLGRLFHGTSLLADQVPLLEQIAGLAREAQVDALLIAGDVYDRAVPPADAVAVLDDFLSRVSLDLGIPVIGIAGNHDSGERLDFGARVMRAAGLHLHGRLPASQEVVVLDDADGPVQVYPLPYADPPMVRNVLDRTDLPDHDACMQALVTRVRAAHPAGRRAVLVAHAFVAGGEASESERPLSVGGSGSVGAERFEGFDYVALGHLHRPQRVGSERVRYAGSLAKYSFSEAEHRKSVSVVELDASGGARVEEVALTARRDLRIVEGRLEQVLRGPTAGESADDYLLVRLTDEGALLGPMDRLREVYPNVMAIERPALMIEASPGAAAAGHHLQTEAQLFADFFEQVTGGALSEDERATYAATLDGADSP